MKCPRCHDPDLDVSGPLSSSCCAQCGGGLIPDDGLQLLLDELKYTRDELRELASLFGGERLGCPSCKSKMSPLKLRGRVVDLCFGCGSMWVDRGELEAITSDRHKLPTPRVPEKAASTTIQPAQALVRIDERHPLRHMSRLALAAGGTASVVWSVIGVVPFSTILLGAGALAAAGVLSRRKAFDVLPRARRMLRWSGFFAPDARDTHGEPFSQDSCVVVRRPVVGQAVGSGWLPPYVCIDLVDGDGRQLVRLRRAVLPHRAWQLAPRFARALGVPLRFDVDPNSDDADDEQQRQRRDLPPLLMHDEIRVEPEPIPSGRMRRLMIRTGAGAHVGVVEGELAMGRPRDIATLLKEHFIVRDGASNKSMRFYPSELFKRNTTLLVSDDNKGLGHVALQRGFLADHFAWSGPQGRRGVRASIQHGGNDGSIVDGYGRRVGVIETLAGAPSDARKTEMHIFPGRMPGDARWGLIALAVHVSMASIFTEA